MVTDDAPLLTVGETYRYRKGGHPVTILSARSYAVIGHPWAWHYGFLDEAGEETGQNEHALVPQLDVPAEMVAIAKARNERSE